MEIMRKHQTTTTHNWKENVMIKYLGNEEKTGIGYRNILNYSKEMMIDARLVLPQNSAMI